jgi:uncharacterized membrane protein YfcA
MTSVDIGAIATLLVVGLAAGFLAGLLGVGGGILMVPAMVMLLGFDQHVAQGTSLLVIIPAAVSGSWTHYRGHQFALRDASALAAGGMVGAIVGAVFALSLDDELLRRLFGLFLLASAARILVPKLRARSGTPT